MHLSSQRGRAAIRQLHDLLQPVCVWLRRPRLPSIGNPTTPGCNTSDGRCPALSLSQIESKDHMTDRALDSLNTRLACFGCCIVQLADRLQP